MKKETIFSLLYILLIVCLILFMVFMVWYLTHENTQCVLDPIEYAMAKTRSDCFCIKYNG